MDRKTLFEKWYKHKEHDYEITETMAVTDGGRPQDITFLYSGRNRGKSFDVSSNLLADAWYDGKTFGYIRRNVANTYEIENYFADKIDFIRDMTDGAAEGITKTEGKLQFFRYETTEKGVRKRVLVKDAGNFFAVSKESSYRSMQFPNIYNLLYEEVLTDGTYIQAEAEKILNIFSTCKRNKTGFHMWLISNLVSVVNPYSKSWGIYLTRQKAGEIKLTRLYLGAYDEKGSEKYLLIGTHYLKDKADISKEDKKKDRLRVKTAIASNKWDEVKLFPHLDLNFVKQYDIIDTVVFEYEDVMLQGNIIEVPKNVYNVYVDGDAPCDAKIPVLYIRRKTSCPHSGTRLYTNNALRFSEYVTRGFTKIYKIDLAVERLIQLGWIFGADNLTMNDFNNIFNKLRLMKLGY